METCVRVDAGTDRLAFATLSPSLRVVIDFSSFI